jgi:hypothetical protein
MPRVAVRLPEYVLWDLRARAEEQEARNALWEQALTEYAERKGSAQRPKTPSHGERARHAAFEAKQMPRTAVEVSDALFARMERLAKRLHMSRDLLYAECMAEFLRGDVAPDIGFGHHDGGEGAPPGSESG